MIHTAKQLKDKVKNMSGGNSEVAQALIRTYFMERFLERVSVSEYRNNFILKGGMLVASIVGVDMRATMDIDTTVKALPLNEKDARAIIERIGVAIPPKLSISSFMGYLKGKSTLMIYDRHPELQSKWNKAFWARGYYVETIGNITDEAVQKYIKEQAEESRKEDSSSTAL